jgi:hypothetical protein
VFNKKGDYHYLKTDDEVSPTPYYAIFGVICIAAMVAMGYFLLKPKPVVANTKTDVPWSVQPGQSQQFSPPGANFASYPQNSGAGGPSYAAPSNAFARAQAGQQTATSSRPVSDRGQSPADRNNVLRDLTVLMNGNPGADLASGFSANLTIFVQSVKFSLVEDHKGVTHLVGDVVVVNDMASPLTSGKLWLEVAGFNKFELKPYDGSVNGPKWLPPFSIGSKQSVSCHVMAMGFKAWGPMHAEKRIGVDAKVASEPVHSVAEIKEQAPAEAAD